MADNKMNKDNETMQREQAKASIGGERKPEQGKNDEDRREQGRLDKEGRDKEGREKSAIGGGEKGQGGQSGQSGQGSQSPTGQSGSQNREFDKSRSEPTSR